MALVFVAELFMLKERIDNRRVYTINIEPA